MFDLIKAKLRITLDFAEMSNSETNWQKMTAKVSMIVEHVKLFKPNLNI